MVECHKTDLLLVKIELLVKILCIFFGLLFLFILCMLPTGE